MQKDAFAIIAARRSTETYFQRRDCTSRVAGQLQIACPCRIAVDLDLADTCFDSCQRMLPSGTSVNTPYPAAQASVVEASGSAVAEHIHETVKGVMAVAAEVATSDSEDSRHMTESVDAQLLRSYSWTASLGAFDWVASWTLLVRATSSDSAERSSLRMWAGSSANQHATSSPIHDAGHLDLQQLVEPAV